VGRAGRAASTRTLAAIEGSDFGRPGEHARFMIEVVADRG
jgi:hypothetical protein